MLKTVCKQPLWLKILLGMILGLVFGLTLKFIGKAEYAMNIKFIGDIFVRLIKMIVVPLVLLSITSAVINIKDITKAGKMGIMSFGIYLFTTTGAIILALILANILNLGDGVNLKEMLSGVEKKEIVNSSVTELITNMFPSNIFVSLSTANMLQIIIFAMFFGGAIQVAGDKGTPVRNFVLSANEVIAELTNLVMSIAPLGVFALITWVSATQDSEQLSKFFYLIISTYAIAMIHMFIFQGGMVLLLAKRNVIWFFSKILPAQLTAFSTCSSSATLPVTIKVARERLGVSESTSGFVLPLGTTINMDGSAIYLGIIAVFTATAMGVDLTMSQYVLIALTATLASIGSAGVPSASLVMMTLVLTSVGLPPEVTGIIIAFDRILDMMRTVVNVTGDLTTALVVDSFVEKDK